MANDPYEPDDASDSDEDARERRERDARARFERDVEDELGDATDVDERSWEGFWRRATAENAAKMRRAGLDPDKAESKGKFGRHGEKLEKGKCATTLCFGCDARCDETFECAQCLEIYRARAKKVAFDAWERAFFCSCNATSRIGMSIGGGTGRAPRGRRRWTAQCTSLRRRPGSVRFGTDRICDDWSLKSAHL